jgi:hypothetical protein
MAGQSTGGGSLAGVGKRQRKRARSTETPGTSYTEYADPEGNVLVLRDRLSPGSVGKLREPVGGAAADVDDMWRRRTEMLFERLAVSWEIAGLPLKSQKELLGRYRMADSATQQWVREAIDEHVRRKIPELAG